MRINSDDYRHLVFWLHLAVAAGLSASLLTAVPRPAAAGEALPLVSGPIGMDQAVDLALRHSRKIKAAAADEQVMTSMRREVFSGFLPQASANGYLVDQSMMPNVYSSAGETMARNFQAPGTNRFQDLNLTAMWSLFAGGRTYYGYKAAAARAEAAKEMSRGTEVEVAMQARLDYIAVLREQENALATAEMLKQTEEMLRLTREEYAAGRVARVNVLRDEAELANVVQMDNMARNRAEFALIALKTTLGLDLTSSISPAEPLAFVATAVSVEDGLRQVLASHPEVQAAVRQTEASESEKRAAYGRYLPEVSAVWMYDWAQMNNAGEPVDYAEGYSVGLVMTVPLFDGFMRENAINTARSKQGKIREQEMQARQQVVKEVNEAALMLTSAEKNVEASKKGLERAEEQFRIARERFAGGRGIQLELLDAHAVLYRARFNAVAALADHQTARAMWLKATGRVR